MAEIVLFHSALGLRPGVLACADRLRAAGHTVHTPDLFDGEVFADLDQGVRKRDGLGISEIARGAQEAVAHLPARLVFAGFSLGAGPAELLAATRPGARGAVLMHGALPIESFEPFGIQGWPTGVPMQVHYADEDPWVEGRNVAAVRAAVQRAGVGFEAYTYPGSGHLFADPDLPEHDAASSELMWRRVLEFVDRVATRK